MLEKSITYKLGNGTGNGGDWDLSFPIDANYANQKKRVLVVLQTVDGRDLKEKAVLGSKQTRTAFIESLKLARRMARQRKPNLGDFGLAVVNYNSRRHLHLRDQARAEAESEFKTRLLAIIKKLGPTHILFSGDLSKLYPVKDAQLKNGWVHDIEDRKVCSTVDFSRLLEKQGLYANLLGFFCRHFANLLCGSLPYSLKDLKARSVLVDTMDRFRHMMAEWDKAESSGGETGLDTETKNLTVNKNRVFTMQMAFSHDPLTGYVLPIDHPHKDNPFSIDERKEIKRELQSRFRDPKRKGLLICFNGAFDLRVIRKSLHIPIIYMPIWECMAGEHNLDENCSSLRYVGVQGDAPNNTSPNGLAGVFCSYGNDFYLQDSGFTKADRATVASVSPRNKDFLRYAANDVVSMHGIKASQIERAGEQTVDGRNYRPLFIRHMLHQMSDTVHQLSHLKEDGSLVNKRYLRSLLKPDSVLVKAIAELGEEFKLFPEVQAANKALLGEKGFKVGSLFGPKEKGGSGAWTFSFTKNEHKAKLFFDVMGMEPINKTDKGAPSVDKDFIETYKDRNFIVEKFGEFTAASKMLGTNVKGWLKLLRAIDGALDNHLRSDVIFFDVDTGRLASRNPNLQNIPNRGKLSKIIKEMFITADGHLLVRYDFSAHEIRGWSIVAFDKVLASAFKAGQALRQKWIKAHPPMILVNSNGEPIKLPMSKEIRETYEKELKVSKDKARISLLKRVIETDDIAGRLKKEGDVHIQNVFRFLKKWVDKSHPLRDAIKQIVFGVVYGKSAATLGHDTKKAEFDELKAKMGVAHKAGDKKALSDLEEKYSALMEDDREDYAQNIIDKMFDQFKMGQKWLKRMSESAENQQQVWSPIYRIRHLYATLTKDRQIVSRQIRRGMNAPIQGFASEISVKASRLTMVDYYRLQPKLKALIGLDKKAKFPIRFNRCVHDASYYTVPYAMVLPFMHILQYDATYGITKAYKDEFDLEFTVEPEIEMEVGAQDTKSRKWSWALPELLTHIEAAVDDGIKAGFLTEAKDQIMEQILKPYRSDECLTFLNARFPFLGIDLKTEIMEALESFETGYKARARAARIAAKKEKEAA